MTQLPKMPFFPNKHRHSWVLWFFIIMCKWSRPMLLCISQEKCVTSEMVAYIEQWFGGLVSEPLWRMVLYDVSCSVIVVCWENMLVEAGRETETTDLIVLTFSKHLHLCLDSALAFQCMCWLSSRSVFVCCLPTCLPASLGNIFLLCCLAAHLPCDFYVPVCLPFSLSAWLSVSLVYLSVVKTFYWLTVTKRGLKC